MTKYSDKNEVKELIKSPATMTDTFVDLGEKVCTKGLDNIALWLNGSKELSDLVRIRVKCYTSDSSTDAYYTQVQTIGADVVQLNEESYEISAAAINLVLPLGISTLAPYIQIEAKADTVGATAAHIDEAYVSFDRR